MKMQKQTVLEILLKVPIVQVAVKRAGISRATFYRWRQEDSLFDQAVETVLHEGALAINDLAQSKLIELINQGNLTALIFWLKSRDPLFSDRKVIINEFRTAPVAQPVTSETKEAMNSAFALFEAKARSVRDDYMAENEDD